MQILRWLSSFPAAMLSSFLAWAATKSVFHHSYFGGGVVRSVVGLAPNVISTAVPSLVFTLVGVIVAPIKNRIVVFVFAGLSLLFSGGGMDLIIFSNHSLVEFWAASLLGCTTGCFMGLFFGLRIQARRSGYPNRHPQPNSTS